MDYIRRTYGVPAKRGGRVRYFGAGIDEFGVILSARNGRIRVRLDHKTVRGRAIIFNLHPMWALEYLKTYNVELTGDDRTRAASGSAPG